MNYNFHTHTVRCSHATGTEEEYVQRAIENGIRYMGFSDHAPFRFDDGYEALYRVPESDAKTYCNEIRELAEKYKDQAEIRVGFEMEYYPELFDEMLKRAVEHGAEYLLLGQHWLEPEHNETTAHVTWETEDPGRLKTYVSLVTEAMKTGRFTYVAHPDIIRFTGDLELYREEMRKICAVARELQIPLEINFLGIRESRHYPREEFWQIAGEEKCPVTFGFDAHDTAAAYDGESLVRAKEMVEKYSLNYIGMPELVTELRESSR